jgi:hypothetical protein
MNEKIKFITDSSLGKLARWLRILGYDTAYHAGYADRAFLREAQKQGRVVLTRKKDMAQRQFSGRIAVIHHECVEDQLEEIITTLSLVPEEDQIFTLCLRCNEKLAAVSKEEVSGTVPDYVLRCHGVFYRCHRCGGAFWPGTHREKVKRIFRSRIQRRPP